MNITKYNIIGLICMLVFMLCGFSQVKGSVIYYIVYCLVFLLLSVLSVVVISIFMPDNKAKSWIMLVPVTIALIFSVIVLKWNVLVPFMITGYSFVCIDACKKIIMNEKYPFKDVMKICVGGFGSVILFICLFAFFNITI